MPLLSHGHKRRFLGNGGPDPFNNFAWWDQRIYVFRNIYVAQLVRLRSNKRAFFGNFFCSNRFQVSIYFQKHNKHFLGAVKNHSVV